MTYRSVLFETDDFNLSMLMLFNSQDVFFTLNIVFLQER